MKEIGRNYTLSIILGSFASVLLLCTSILLYKSTMLGTVYIKTNGNPEEVLCWFYDCIETGAYSDAYSCLCEYSDLGLAKEDAEEMESELVVNTLRNSYKCKIVNDVEVSGLKAKTDVEFTYLDLAVLQEKIEEGITPVLEEYIENMSREEIYDESGDYTAEFLQMVYNEVLENVIETQKDIFVTKTYQVDMKYTKDGWKILTNKDMINCFLGGKIA